MKTAALVLALLIVFTGVLTVSDKAEAIGVRISGGYTYIKYSNFNNWVDYVNNTILPLATITGATFDKINWIPEFKGEVLLPGIPFIESGLGAGIIMGSSDFALSMQGQNLSLKHKMRAYPLTYTAYFDIPVPFVNIKPMVYGGLGAYYSKITFSESVSGVENYSSESDLTTWGFGIHGGAGIAFSVAPTITIDLSIFGRWADIKGFDGTMTDPDGDSEDAYLAYDEIYDLYGFGKNDLYYGAMSNDMKSTVAEGSVDLSGYGFAVGLKIGF